MLLAVIELVEDILRIGTYGGLMVYEFFSEPLEHFIYSLVPARACHHPLSLASCSEVLHHRGSHFFGAFPVHVCKHVGLVPNDEKYHVFRTQILDFFVPDIFEVFEAIFISDVTDHDGSISIAEVNAGESAELLVASDVPDLQGEALVKRRNMHGFHFLSGPHCGPSCGWHRTSHESTQDCRLAYSRISDKDYLAERNRARSRIASGLTWRLLIEQFTVMTLNH